MREQEIQAASAFFTSEDGNVLTLCGDFSSAVMTFLPFDHFDCNIS